MAKLKRTHWGTPTVEEIEQLISEVSEPTRERLLLTFRSCTEKVKFTSLMKGNVGMSTNTAFVMPFWVLHRRGEDFSASKIAEVAACFAYSISQKDEIDRWDKLLCELRELDLAIWRACLLKLVGHGSEQRGTPSDYSEPMETRRSSPRVGRKFPPANYRLCGSRTWLTTGF